MEWTLAILFGLSIILLLISVARAGKVAKNNQKEIDTIHLALTDEINDIKDKIQNLDYDIEIMFQEGNINLTKEKRLMIRKILDLYTRKYSIQTIAEKTMLSEKEVEEILAPYLSGKAERRTMVK